MKQHLKDYPVVFSIPVQWGELDSFGHVNNIMYFRWCETARIFYLERIGMARIGENRIGPILAAIGCNFRKPVNFPDTVHVGARVTKVGTSSFKMEHLLATDALGVVADAGSTIVIMNYATGKSHPIPGEVRAAIAKLENKQF